jgi:4-amino-4-deoxy-L-arabinose transferase-like glycosyltransferase
VNTTAHQLAASRRGRMSAVWSALRRAVGSLPRSAVICALVAFASAVTFAAIVPPFQVPDEPEHYSYIEYIAQSGRLPHAPAPATEFSPQEQAALEGLYSPSLLGGEHFGRPPWTSGQMAHVYGLLSASPSRRGQGGVTGESDNPPLYYALAVIPYEIGGVAGGGFLERLAAMRLLSALLSALTALLVFCFVREVMPSLPWGATVAGLLVALQPQVGFIAGGVNNDNLLFTASAALLLALARAFRRGLSPSKGAAIGASIAVGLLTKLTFIGLLPGVAVALALLCLRRGEGDRRNAWRGAAVAASIPAGATFLYVVLNSAVWHRSLFQGALGASTVSGGAGSSSSGNIRELLSYLRQFYLPRLPGMRAQFDVYPLWHVWFQGFIGRLGLLDYGFPHWVYFAALAVFLVLLALVIRAVRSELGLFARHWRELLTYAVIALGLLAAIARAGLPYHNSTHFIFEQARYLFPLLSLYGLFIAVALRGAGRRWAVPLAVTLVSLALIQDLYAQLLTLQRYYT